MIHTGDCVDVMATLPEASVDAIVTDPPYGLEFMGKEWDRLDVRSTGPRAGFGKSLPLTGSGNPTDRLPSPSQGGGQTTCRNCGGDRYRKSLNSGGRPRKLCQCAAPDFPQVERIRSMAMGEWHQRWATEALRVAKPGAYLLAFGGTRTYHRLACAIEDAGWIIRDCLVWAYAQGFPKSRALLKPAWEPIVMARKLGPLRELAIDECRIGTPLTEVEIARSGGEMGIADGRSIYGAGTRRPAQSVGGRWPANVILTDPIFDGDVDGVVGGGETSSGFLDRSRITAPNGIYGSAPDRHGVYASDTGTYSRFFLIPKADRADREPNGYGRLGLDEEPYEHSGPRGHSLNGDGTPRPRPRPRLNGHPTVKPLELMRHLVRLVTPPGGTCLDPFLGSGTTAIAAEMEGFAWIGIEREAEYVAIAEARLAGVQRGMGLIA